MSVYSDLEKRVLRLVNAEATISALAWEKEAHAIKTQARKAYAMNKISHNEMCRLIKMVMEAEYYDGSSQ
jgi:hypothetical protein